MTGRAGNHTRAGPTACSENIEANRTGILRVLSKKLVLLLHRIRPGLVVHDRDDGGLLVPLSKRVVHLGLEMITELLIRDPHGQDWGKDRILTLTSQTQLKSATTA